MLIFAWRSTCFCVVRFCQHHFSIIKKFDSLFCNRNNQKLTSNTIRKWYQRYFITSFSESPSLLHLEWHFYFLHRKILLPNVFVEFSVLYLIQCDKYNSICISNKHGREVGQTLTRMYFQSAKYITISLLFRNFFKCDTCREVSLVVGQEKELCFVMWTSHLYLVAHCPCSHCISYGIIEKNNRNILQ